MWILAAETALPAGVAGTVVTVAGLVLAGLWLWALYR